MNTKFEDDTEDFQKPSRKSNSGKKKQTKERGERIVPDDKIYKRSRLTKSDVFDVLDEDDFDE